MNTFKTAVVLAALLGVGYGVHVVLNKPLNNNVSLEQSAQMPFDEFGLPNVDIQQSAQGIVGNAQGMINQAQGAVGQVVNNVNQAVNNAGQALSNTGQALNNGQPFADGGAFQLPEITPPGGVSTGAASNFQNQITNATQNAANTMQNAVDRVQNTVGNMQNSAGDLQGMAGNLQGMAANLQDNVSAQANGFVDQANNMMGQAQAAFAGQAQNAVNQAREMVGNVAGQARDTFGQAADTANQFAANAQNQIQNGIDAAQNAASDLSLNPEDFPDLPSLDEPVFSAPTNGFAQQQAQATPQQNFVPAETADAFQPATNATAPPTSASMGTHGMAGLAPPSGGSGTASMQGHRYNAQLPSSAGISRAAFASMWRSAQEKVNAGMPADALFTLSLWYSNPELSTEQRDSLIPMLDELAGKVIYSREHHFGPPHTVQSGETLPQIAAQYAVTPQFIARVNGLEDNALIRPGEQLKVITGPFRAELSRSHREITIFVGSYYAGRFSAGVGRDLPLGEMALEVAEKSGSRPYVDRETNEQTVAGDPGNPYGNYWIGLRVPGAAVNPRVGLHSTGDRVESSDTRGCISLSERDADDLQSILSIGSRFTIHR